MPKETRTKVHTALLDFFKGLKGVWIYHSESSSITMIYLSVDNDSTGGFKRTHFKPSLRSLGTRVLKEQEVPTPWTVSVDSYRIH